MFKSIIKKEKNWEYHCNLTFNSHRINKFTITDYFLKHKEHGITRNLIVELVKMLDNKKIKPLDDYLGSRKVFRWERIPYNGKRYRLVFWFKDGAKNHLWIRNCHPQD